MKKKMTITLLTMFALGLMALNAIGQCCPAPGKKVNKLEKPVEQVKKASKETVKPQTKCPVMGGKINKDLYVDVKGYRIYMCCKGCTGAINKDPDKYIAKIQKNGETPEKTPVYLCKKCGEIKGTEKCCDKEAKKCGCGMIKGSPGCCKMPKGDEKVQLCSGCGEIKGTEKCCDKDSKRCGCGMIKGSPGCCKMPK